MKSHMLLVGKQNSKVIYEKSLAISYKVKSELPYDSAVLLLSIYSNKMKIYIHIEMCVYVCLLIASLSQPSKSGNNPNIIQLFNKL